MRWFRAVVLAFSTYTRIPVPQVKWDDRAMTLAIAFLPVVGIVIGVLVWVWQTACLNLGLSALLFAAVTVALPVWITGGIHMDGFCDTVDALASWQDKERKLEIMKDPHIGAFALIRCCVYLLVSFALLYELYARGEIVGLGLIYVISRCLAAWSALTLPNARKTGMMAEFTKRVDRRAVCCALALFTASAVAGLLWLAPWSGAAALVLCLTVTVWYRRMAMKRFGGVTGDTTGFYLQMLELTLVAGMLIGGIIASW